MYTLMPHTYPWRWTAILPPPRSSRANDITSESSPSLWQLLHLIELVGDNRWCCWYHIDNILKNSLNPKPWYALNIVFTLFDYSISTRNQHGDVLTSPVLLHPQHGPLVRCIKLRVAHASEMPWTFSPPPRDIDADTHVRHARAVMHAGIAN